MSRNLAKNERKNAPGGGLEITELYRTEELGGKKKRKRNSDNEVKMESLDR